MSDHSWHHSEVFASLLPTARAAGLFALTETGFRLSVSTIRVCDFALVSTRPDTNRLFGAADIVVAVEIAETGIARDLSIKRIEYATAGIPHYWIVDGYRFVVHTFAKPIDGEYTHIRTVSFGEPLEVPATGGRTITFG